MTQGQLTKKQKALVRELENIFSLLGLDFRDIQRYERESRTTRLELAKKHVIRAEVIIQYTLIDENLSNILCDYFFGKKKSYIQLWKTRKFQNFNHHVLQELSVLKKLAFVKSIVGVPNTIVRDIERVNSLRNGLAHAFFPENLRRSKPEYKGKNIFTLDGITSLLNDTSRIHDFFFKKLYRV